MSVSLKTQIQSRGQYELHAKCRYCGNAWYPLADKALDPPVEATVKCPKCKEKQHLHWLGRMSSAPTQTVAFPSPKGVVEQKREAQKVEFPLLTQTRTSSENLPAPENKVIQDAKKPDLRPVFKSKLNPSNKPPFRASTKFQGKPFARSEPASPKPESRPEAPAPVREIKIEGDSKLSPGQDSQQDKEPIIEIKRDFGTKPEEKPVAQTLVQAPEQIVETKIVETRQIVETKTVVNAPISQERRVIELEPIAAAKLESKETDVIPARETTPEPKSLFKSEVPVSQAPTEPAEKSKPTFKSSLLKSAQPNSMFRSQMKPDSKEAGIPTIPEIPRPEEPASTKNLAEPKKPRSRGKRELFPQKKQEVEVRESPLEEEPSQSQAQEVTNITQSPGEPKEVLSSGWPSKKKIRKKVVEETTDLETPEGA
ncbi:MAG TPA: hypothetical protein VJN71_09870 [Nitrososphaerales archaeon]|nr:hypothetical protein [Nitrososphaerales archaeon]